MERNKADIKIMQFVSYPNANVNLNDTEKLILDTIHNLGQTSVNELLVVIKPDWSKYKDISKDAMKKVPFKERLVITKHLWDVTMACSKITLVVKRLKQLGCVSVNERGYE